VRCSGAAPIACAHARPSWRRCPIPTASPTCPPWGQQRASQATRDGGAERLAAVAVPKTSAVALALLTDAEALRQARACSILKTATQHDAHPLSVFPPRPGLGTIRSRVLRDALQAIRRLPRVQAVASEARFGTCRQDSAGTRGSTSGTKSGHAHRTGACAAAAPGGFRQPPASQQLRGRLEHTQEPGHALRILAHPLGRAVYARRQRPDACALVLLLRSSGGRVRAPDASRAMAGMSLPCAARGAAWTVARHATGCRGLISLSPRLLLGHALWPLQSR